MENVVRQLNKLIHLDNDAIKAYESAIERLDDPECRSELMAFKRDHERHVNELQRLVRGFGHEPASGTDIKRILTQGKVVLQSIRGDVGILRAMKSNEDQTNEGYEAALRTTGLTADVQRVLQDALADERRHRAWIVARLEEGFERTTSATETIEVETDVHTAYEHWARFEELPRFMSGVREVRRLGHDGDLRFVVDVAGHTMEYVAEVTDDVPDRRVAWSSRDGRETGGVVTFEVINPRRTRVKLWLSYEPEGPLEGVRDLHHVVGAQARNDLRNFKQLVEEGRA